MPRVLLWLLLPLLALADPGALDDRGWHEGQAAARTAEVLAPLPTAPVPLPDFVAREVRRLTLIYYFSPTCGHCQATIPEIVRLHAELGGELDFLGVASERSTPQQIRAFREAFGVPFPLLHDADRALARAIGARSTPTVIVVEPQGRDFIGRLGFYPWVEGLGLELRLRLWPERAFSHMAPGVYQGSRACATCHTVEAASWSLSHHAVAWATLVRRDRQGDAECAGCHVTGMGQPTGFDPQDPRAALTGVGCEACHGPGGPHTGAAVDARASCVGCHDAEHSVHFTVARGLPHIDHYVSAHLSEAEADARWSALAAGEAARPLLAFPEGKNLGVAACEGCHAEQVAAWRGSPHALAMGSLKGDEARDPACVACHATPATPGGVDTLEGFHLAEGVGCESCHGPGEQHAAAPTATNILGLGKTCPECVIEEVCTSCHVQRWDPGWSLHPRLDAVKGHGPAPP